MGLLGFLVVLLMLRGVAAMLFEPGGVARVAALLGFGVLVPILLAQFVAAVLR